MSPIPISSATSLLFLFYTYMCKFASHANIDQTVYAGLNSLLASTTNTQEIIAHETNREGGG